MHFTLVIKGIMAATIIESLRVDTIEDFQEDEKKPVTNIFRKVTFKGLLIVVFVALLLPIMCYIFFIDKVEIPEPQTDTCVVDTIYRIPCGPFNISEKMCLSVSCCYDEKSKTCYHYQPSRYFYQKQKGVESYISNHEVTPFGNPILKELSLTIQEDEFSVKIILSEQTNNLFDKHLQSKNKSYSITTTKDDRLIIEVKNILNTTVLTTAKGPLYASEHLWEWSFQLTTDKLFGLGDTLIEIDSNSTLTKMIYKNRYDHNTLPAFLAYFNGSFHGLIVRHEGPLEVTVMPSKLVILRSLAGSMIELDLVMGPTPRDVYFQLNSLKPTENNVIDEWQLGIHICREEEADDLSSAVKQYKDFLKQLNDKFPLFQYETDCIHNDLLLHMLKSDSDCIPTENKEKYLLSYPPQVPADISSGMPQDIFYNDAAGKLYKGKYKNFDVVYPDYSHPNISVLLNLIQSKFQKCETSGILLTGNWPDNELWHMDYENNTFPYMSEEIIQAMSYTLPWNSTSVEKLHILKHNNYGLTQMEQVQKTFSPSFTLNAVSSFETSRPLVIENVNISWSNLETAIQSTVYNSFFSTSLISIPVCGSTSFYDKELQESLCIRWYIMAATLPVLRISSYKNFRDPTNMNSKYASDVVIDVLNKRRMLLPFYQTILNSGEPLIRPLLYRFYTDINVFNIRNQYMIGEELLIAQPVVPDLNRIKIYLPPQAEVWYEFWGGTAFHSIKDHEWISMPIIETDWIMFVSQGSIIPLRIKENTFNLIIAFNCSLDCTAKGSLYHNGRTIELYGYSNDTIGSNENICRNDITYDYLIFYRPTSVKKTKVDFC